MHEGHIPRGDGMEPEFAEHRVQPLLYLGPIVLLVLIAAGAWSLWCYHRNWPLVATLSAVGGIAAAIAAGIAVRVKTENTAALEKRLDAARKATERGRGGGASAS